MQTQTNFSFTVDVTWCLEQLLKDGRITERDKLFKPRIVKKNN